MATIKLNQKEITKFIKSYEKFRVKNTNPHALEMFKFSGCTISVFKTGKILFQGPKAELSAAKWGYKSPALKSSHKFTSYIGSDEVGTGDFFGPIVVAGVYVDQNTIKYLEKIGVKDSKNLGDEKIITIVEEMKNKVKWDYSIINNIDYNKVIVEMNMNKIKAILHNNALNKLLKYKPQGVIVDEFASEKNYYKYLQDQKNVIPNVILEQKAESKYIGVAAASMFARYIFIKEMSKISKVVGFDIQYGAGPKVDEQIQKLDERVLVKIAKLNFKNYKK